MDNVLTRSRLTEQAALQAKMEHLSMLSRGLAHDLKNLITPISSYLMHTRDRAGAETNEQEVHAAAQQSVRKMTDYIQQAAFFAKELTPRWQTARLAEICQEAHRLTSSRAAQRGITIDLEIEDISLVADTVLAQRLLTNLLNNAIDASGAEDRIRLRARPGGTDRAHVEVSDEGCGIPKENLSRIFEPYFTTKQLGDEVRGFGLGLSICEKIVRLHGGAISVQSEAGRGTTFTVDLPLRPPKATAPMESDLTGAPQLVAS